MAERGHFAENFDERGDRALEQLSTELRCRLGRIPDVAVVSEVVAQPTESDRAAESYVTIGGQVFGYVTNGPRHVDELGMEMEHHRRLVSASVHSHAQLRRR